MYPRSFLCEEAKIKQRTPLKKDLYEIGEEAIRESRFTSFFYLTRGLVKHINISNMAAMILLRMRKWRWGRLSQISRGNLSQCSWLSMRAFSWMIDWSGYCISSVSRSLSQQHSNRYCHSFLTIIFRELILFHFIEYLRYAMNDAILHTNGELYRNTCFHFFH